MPPNDLRLRGLQRGVRSSLVPASKPSVRPGRYCIRRSRVSTSAVSRAMSRTARLARDRFRCDQTDSTGLSFGGAGRELEDRQPRAGSGRSAGCWRVPGRRPRPHDRAPWFFARARWDADALGLTAALLLRHPAQAAYPRRLRGPRRSRRADTCLPAPTSSWPASAVTTRSRLSR